MAGRHPKEPWDDWKRPNRLPRAEMHDRDHQVYEQFKAGIPPSEIALVHDLTTSAVRVAVKRVVSISENFDLPPAEEINRRRHLWRLEKYYRERLTELQEKDFVDDPDFEREALWIEIFLAWREYGEEIDDDLCDQFNYPEVSIRYIIERMSKRKQFT